MQELIKKIHQSPFKVTIVSSGGGTEAISSLLQVPGASNTILESYIPYAKESMDAIFPAALHVFKILKGARHD